MLLSNAFSASEDPIVIDLGSKTIHTIDSVSEIVIRFRSGIPIMVMAFRHEEDKDTGEEVSRFPGNSTRTGDALDADEALKTIASALAPISNRLKVEDDTKIAQDIAISFQDEVSARQDSVQL